MLGAIAVNRVPLALSRAGVASALDDQRFEAAGWKGCVGGSLGAQHARHGVALQDSNGPWLTV
jgi:hypothetical protein